MFSTHSAKQLAPRWKLNTTISQIYTRCSSVSVLLVLPPMKNGNDKIFLVSSALEIWIALNGGKLTALLLCFLGISSTEYKASRWSWIASLHGSGSALQRLSFTCTKLSEPLIPAALLACTGEARTALIRHPEKCPSRAECDIFQDLTQTITFHRTSPPLRVSACRTRCSAAGGHIPGGRREEWNHLDLRDEPGWLSDHSQPFSSHLKTSSFPTWFSQTLFLLGLLNNVNFFFIAWTPSTLKPQESAGAQSHHSLSLFCKWGLIAKFKLTGSAHLTELWLSFGSRTKYFHNTDQNCIITMPKEKPAHNQVLWLVTSGLWEVFGICVQSSCSTY